MSGSTIQVDDLSIGIDKSEQCVLEHISLSVKSSQCLVLVGASGSGKTTLLMSLMGYLRESMQVRSGSISINNRRLMTAESSVKNSVCRGKEVSLVPQNAGAHLTPTLRVGQQIEESLKLHTEMNSSDRKQKVLELMEDVNLPDPVLSARKYPHQLSGGQQQRVAIAMAMAPNPGLLLLDEPTSGLDWHNAQDLLILLKTIRDEKGTTLVMVTHDLDVASEIADQIAVMQQGKLIEYGATEQVLSHKEQSYTQHLLNAFKPSGIFKSPPLTPIPIILTHNLSVDRRVLLRPGHQPILNNIRIAVSKGETVVITGESGSGKSTLLRALAGLESVNKDAIHYRGQVLAEISGRSLRQKKDVQLVFQNSDLALNPKQRVEDILLAPLRLYFSLTTDQQSRRVDELLEQVNLSLSYRYKYPGELSGGERQRVAIARACAAEPELLLCDEITAALDVVNRNEILQLLRDRVNQQNCACIMVTHDHEVIRQMASRVYELKNGKVKCHYSCGVQSEPLQPQYYEKNDYDYWLLATA